MGHRRKIYMISMGRTDVKRPLERPKRRWGNIKMDFQEMGWGIVDVVQDRDRWWGIVNAVVKLRGL
jgi:hypothetical protein